MERFIADAMLGRLARWLRILGCDVYYRKSIADAELLRTALEENRWILTRDTALVRRKRPPRTTLIRSDHLKEQLRQVVAEHRITPNPGLFRRCIECNEPLAVLPAEEAGPEVPPYVAATVDSFSRCPGCHRIYWRGTHYWQMLERLVAILPAFNPTLFAK